MTAPIYIAVGAVVMLVTTYLCMLSAHRRAGRGAIDGDDVFFSGVFGFLAAACWPAFILIVMIVGLAYVIYKFVVTW